MLTATLRIGSTRKTVNIVVSPEGSPDGEIRLYLGSEWLELPGATADELARLLTLYRTEQKAVQS